MNPLPLDFFVPGCAYLLQTRGCEGAVKEEIRVEVVENVLLLLFFVGESQSWKKSFEF